MRTLGILGGIGPQATMAFEARIHRVCQRRIPQKGNRGYPPLVTVYLRHPPVEVLDDQTPRRPLVLDRRLLEAARRLGSWADLLVIPSNTPHLFLDEIAEAAGCEVLSIVDPVADALRAAGVRRVGLVGLGLPEIYLQRFAEQGLAVLTADEPSRAALDAAIIRLMEGVETDTGRAAASEALRQVRRAGAQKTVLGCTEIPLLLGDAAAAEDLIDPADLLAERAVERALG